MEGCIMKKKEYEEHLAQLTEENEILRKSLKSKRSQISDLKVGLNKRLLMGNNILVSIHYAEEIMLYMAIRHIAIKAAHEKNKKREYLFIFKTNAKRLSKQFQISYNKARKILSNLEKMGALKKVKIERDQLCVYELGKRVKTYFSGRLNYVNSFHFNLSRKKTKDFFDREKEKLKG